MDGMSVHPVSRRLVLAAGGGLAAAAVTGLPGPVAAAPGTFYVGGTYNSSSSSPAPWEARIGVPLGVHRTFWTASQVSNAMAAVTADIVAGRRCSEISFKGPYSWYRMARGSGDNWMRDIRSRLQAILAPTDHVVKLILHHEPENDTGTNNGRSDSGRDNWRRWQSRAANIFAGVTGLEFGCCLMGWYCFYGNQGSRWFLDNCITPNSNLKFVSFDIYQVYGTNGRTDWTNWESSYFSKIGPWCADRGVEWGLSEFGVTQKAFNYRPNVFTDLHAAMVRHGGQWLDYFNTTLNNTDPANPWAFSPGDTRELAYSTLIRNRNV